MSRKTARLFRIFVCLGTVSVSLGLFMVLLGQSGVATADNHQSINLIQAKAAASATSNNCFAQIEGSNYTYSSTDSAAVQNAIDAASDHDWLKIAGNCTGGQTKSGTIQTAYLAKPLTLTGGYAISSSGSLTEVDWTTHDPDNHQTILDANGEGRVVYASSNATGGALYHLTLQNGYIEGNKNGAGMILAGDADFTISRTTFISNTSGQHGGGLYIAHGKVLIYESTFMSNTTTNRGGGMRMNGDSADVTVERSTFSHNQSGGWGGGIYVHHEESVFTLTNSTLSQNTAGSSGSSDGAALHVGSSKYAEIMQSTLVSNTGSSTLASFAGAIVTTTQSVIGHSLDNVGAEQRDCDGEITLISGNYNLLGNGTDCGFTLSSGDITGTVPLLGELADNGGATLTHLPATNSPLLQAVPSAMCATAADQRGIARPTYQGCDIGAVELASGLACVVQNSDTTADYASADNSALQEAIDEAADGDTLKIAGTCAGVQTKSGSDQTGYISKTLTLEGGYDGATWDKSAYTESYTTTLSAEGNGRVLYMTGNTTVTLDSLTLTDGQSGNGAGLYSDNEILTIQNSTIENSNGNKGGGLYASVDILTVLTSTIQQNGGSQGGGLFVDTATEFYLSNSRILSNTASDEGGGVYFDSNSLLTIINSALEHNLSGDVGGGFYIVTIQPILIQASVIRYNIAAGSISAGGGGGGHIRAAGSITQSIISHNQANTGGGLSIYELPAGNELMIQNSLIWDNTAADEGGGMFSNFSNVTLINSTISQNSADLGAAVHAVSNSDVSFFHTTVISNVVSAGGVIQHEEDSAFRFGQTILAYNAPNNCDENNSDLNNNGYNVDDDDTCSLGGSNGQVNVDPLLQGLAENNGKTAGVIGHTQVISSHAVPSDSNAFDYIPYNSNGCGTTYTTDQRGVARPQDPFQNCTVGAFEYVGDRVPVATADSYALDANTTLTVAASGVLANDSDPLSRTLSAVIETAPSDGIVDLAADGSFVYTPTTDFVGTDLFTYTADNGIYTGTAVVTLTVSGGNCHVYNDGATYGSFDAGAVQEAIDKATAGDTLKIAGTCTGVETVASENQTGYISKTLTLEGGYDGVTWDKSAYTTTYTTTLSADDNGRVIYIAPSTTATLTHLILRDGAATNGGGVYIATDSSLSVISSTLTSNQATNDGGAIYATSADVLQISGSLIDDNIAYGSAAGMYIDMTDAVSITHSVVSNNQNTLGQDIIHITGNQTEFQLLGSTIEGNTADTGGILVVYSGRSTLENSTISDNEIFQNGVIEGGAIYAAGGEITITHSTIVSNTGIEGLVSNGSTPINLTHTIIAHHGEDDCKDVNVTAAYSLDSDGSCGLTGSGGNLSSTDPLLDPLAANDGLTAGATGESTINTHAVSAASPIIDLVPYGANGCGTTAVVADQRGVTRPQDPGAYCTAGAFEYVGDRVPVAAADRYDVAPNTALTVAASGVLGNDSDPLSRPLSATVETAPSNGVLALAADGSFVYTPTTDFSGTDLFTYTADSGTYTDTAVVTIMVGDLSCAVYNDGTLYETVDAYAVQEAIDEATAGDTLKIAGTCTGATATDGTDQTAYISKTLTLAGGYTTTNWSTAGGYTTTLDANAQGRSVFVTNNAAVTLTSLIMRNGYIPDYSVQGGGIFANDDTELNLIDTVLSTGDTFSQTDSSATISGLGIYMGENGVLKIDSSEISENRAIVASLGRGGGIYLESYAQLYMVNSVVSHNELTEADEYTFHPMRGGGIYASNDTILEITSSDISHNKMIDNPGPAAVSLYGGGMYISVGTAFTLTNSSVTYNEASSYAGIFLDNVDRSTLTNSTISHNSGGRGVSISGASSVATLTHMTIFDNEDGGASMSGLTLTLYNTIIAGNGGNNCSGTMVDGGYNLDDDDSCGLSATGSLTMTDALLETLADNGGETQTNGLPSNSPAVDQIPNGTNGCGTDYTTDQRGVARPQNSSCDIGAFELMGDPAVTPTVAISWTVPNTVTLSWAEEPANVSYEIFRSDAPYSGFVSQGSISDSPFVQEVDAGSIVSYFYMVQASGSGGDTADSETVGLFQFSLTPGD